MPENNGSFEGKPLEHSRTIKFCLLSGDVPPAADDIAIMQMARTAPHSCSIEGCPGRENKRKLEAAETIERLARQVMNDLPFSRDWLDPLLERELRSALKAYRGEL